MAKWKGLTRQDLIEATSMKTGGGLTAFLEELEASAFIQFNPSVKRNVRNYSGLLMSIHFSI